MPKDIILCVDDEPIVLRICSKALALAGFRPVVAENGAAGLEVFTELKDEICLVLADIVLPGVNGLAMAECILEIVPHAAILLMSGYSDSVIERHGRQRFPFIRKPFSHAALIDKVRSLLASPEIGCE